MGPKLSWELCGPWVGPFRLKLLWFILKILEEREPFCERMSTISYNKQSGTHSPLYLCTSFPQVLIGLVHEPQGGFSCAHGSLGGLQTPVSHYISLSHLCALLFLSCLLHFEGESLIESFCLESRGEQEDLWRRRRRSTVRCIADNLFSSLTQSCNTDLH